VRRPTRRRSPDRPSPRPVVAAAVLTLAVLTGAPGAASAADAKPWFLSSPTDQLGVPGAVETAELTPQGSLYTGRLELAVRAGSAMRPWTGNPRTADASGLPVYRWNGRVGALSVQASALAADTGGVPAAHLRLVVVNREKRRRPFGLGLDTGWLGAGLKETGGRSGPPRATDRFPRNVADGVGLLTQPGDPFDPSWKSAWAGDTLERSGSPLLSARLTGSASRTRIVRTTAPSSKPDAVTGRVRITGTLNAGERRTVEVVVPLRAVPAGHPALTPGFEAALRRVRAAWRPVLDRGMQVDTPEPAVDRAWRSGLVTMLGSRYRLDDGRWIQTPNKMQYQASWIRDTTNIAHALDLLGFTKEAGEDIEFLPRWQDGVTGLLASRQGQLDGMGQALFSFGDHVARSRDTAMASRLLPVADRAVDWVRGRLAADPKWILPSSDPKNDNEFAAGHTTGDLVWLAGGTRRLVELARTLGDQARVADWSAVADQVGAIARARIAESAKANGGVVPPVLDAKGGRRWGEMWMAWPTGVLSPTDPIVARTMAAAKRDEREGIARWGGRLHLYLGLRRLHTELLAGRRAETVRGLYSHLAHLTSTGGTWEQGAVTLGSRGVGRALGPHAWAAGDLLSLIHDMLVREDGSEIRVLDAVPPAWLKPGRTTRVRNAATIHGTVDVSLRATRTGATLTWSTDAPANVPVVFRAPADVTSVRLPGVKAGERRLVLPGSSGTLRLRWKTGRGVERARDADDARDALMRLYATKAR
jgi:hypothetical protein